MKDERLFSLRNPWFTTSVGATLALAALAALIGLVWLPYAQPNEQWKGIWDAICSAAGVPRVAAISEPVKSDFPTSNVVLISQMPTGPDSLSIGRGATLGLQCAICHGSHRQSQIDTPNLEGQPVASIYKELADFKAGARTNAVMGPFALKMSEQDMIDLAAYYADLPRQPGLHPDAGAAAPRTVVSGAAMRNIPPCSSCHAISYGKVGSPWLEGQSAVYIKLQLQAFASGARRNDITAQMRNIARQMTTTEIDDSARYFAGQP